MSTQGVYDEPKKVSDFINKLYETLKENALKND